MIQEVFSNPILLGRELNRLINQKLGLKNYNTSGIDIFKQDWDNMIILDSCRYDVFEKNFSYDGELSKKNSRGTGTKEFLFGNFSRRELLDVVYISANPQLYYNKEKLNVDLHAVENLWREDCWNEDLGTVTPSTLKSKGIELANKYDNKRLIFHFVQPHRPFIGEMAMDHPELSSVFDPDSAAKPKVSEDTYWEAYEENLTLTLPYVYEMLEQLSGKTVVTSDHGQAINNPLSPIPIRDYGHWSGNYIEELVMVPWFETEFESRKEIVSEQPRRANESEVDGEVIQRLERLGYSE
jgi:hypothetical protein